jgi:hypothetical protein
VKNDYWSRCTMEEQAMNSNVRTLFLLRRVGERAALGMWRNRGGLALALLVSLGLLGYVLVSPGGTAKAQAQSAPTSTSADCANMVMTALTSTSAAAAQQAYQCVEPAIQQTVSEPSFVQQLQALRVANASRIDRLGTYQAPTGNTLVYYAVDTSGGSVGYVVYLGPDGKVVQIK